MIAATYVDYKTFTVVGNETTAFHDGRRIKAIGNSTTYGNVASSSYSTITTVTLTEASDNLDASLTGVLYGIVSANNSSIPEHGHVGEDSGGLISVVVDHGALTGLGGDDHTQYHNDARGDARYYTETELDAGQLDNRYNTESEITTISGNIVSQIPIDYYTTSEVDTISGSLDNKLNTHKTSDDHDGRYYTESEVDTISGSIAGQIITAHSGLTGLSGDDHTHYTLVDGTRAFTAPVGGITPIADTDLTTKGYVDGEVDDVIPIGINHTIVRYDGTDAIQDSGITINDYDDMSGAIYIYSDYLMPNAGTNELYSKSLMTALPGQTFRDYGMGILYDRNELTKSYERGSITVTVSGSTQTVSTPQNFTDASGAHATIGYITVDTESIVIECDTGMMNSNFSHAKWQPFFQYRSAAVVTPSSSYANNIVVEVSSDGITWIGSSGSEWSTSDFVNDQEKGLWMGKTAIPYGLPGYRWRYCRFTLTDFVVGYTYAYMWIAQIGMRHVSAPIARQYLLIDQPKIYGNLQTNGNWICNDGSDEGIWIDTNGYVGIGTDSPASALNLGSEGSLATGLTFGTGQCGIYQYSDELMYVVVDGYVRWNYGVAVLQSTDGEGAGIKYNGASLTNPTVMVRKSDSDTGIGSGGDDQLSLITGGVNAITIDSSQQVGIGTTSPAAKLEVATDSFPNIKISNTSDDTGAMMIGTQADNHYWKKANSTGRWLVRRADNGDVATFDFNNLSVGIGLGDITPSAKLHVDGDGLFVDDLELESNLILPETTHVGTDGIIYKDVNLFIHDFNYGDNGTVTTAGYNVFVGESSGNVNMGSAATLAYHGSYNTAYGPFTLRSNTNGYQNTALGFKALYDNNTGRGNTAVGYIALQNNTTGKQNTAVGFNSAGANISGDFNTSVGDYSLAYILSSNHNVGIGYQAGRLIVSSANNETSSTSIYIGSYTRAGADGDTNEIVIGYQAEGIGNNTVVLGNDAVVTTRLKGNVGIGTDSPGSELDVVGDTELHGSLTVGEDAAGEDVTFYGATTGRYMLWDESANTIELNGVLKIDVGTLSTFRVGSADWEALSIGPGATAGVLGVSIGGFSGKNYNSAFNVFIGYHAGGINTGGVGAGGGNIGIGAQTLGRGTTGQYNTAIGNGAMQYISTGGDNLALGASAGSNIAGGGNNQTSSTSIYIGGSSKAGADGNTNEIVIGRGAEGIGSNTVVLGSDLVVTTSLKGDIGIGTDTPQAELDVNGDVIVGGDITISGSIINEVITTNGFTSDQRTATDITFDNGSRTFTISGTATDYHYFIDGYRYDRTTADTVIIDNTEGLHVIYYDGTTLTSVVNPNDGAVDSVIRTKCIVAMLYWDATSSGSNYFADERHGIGMAPETHSYLHFTRGAQFLYGYALGDFVISNGADDEDAQFSITTGSMVDEDITTTSDAITSTVGLPIYYLDGANGYVRRIMNSGFSVLDDITAGAGATGRLVYNEWTGATWQLTTVGANNFVLCHIYAMNGVDGSDQHMAIVGIEEYGNISAARLGASTEISDIITRVPYTEIIPIGTIIFKTGNYSNGVKAKVVLTDDGDNYIDWRTTELAQGGTTSSHSNLTNLNNDDHTQYTLVDGTRAFTGEVAGIYPTASGSLTTKGYVDDEIITVSGNLNSTITLNSDHRISAHAPSNADNTASNETSHSDVVVDGDFTSDGFLVRSGGSGSYSIDLNSYSTTAHNHSGVYEPVDTTILREADVDDTPVNGVTDAPISSNWAYDHADDSDAHHNESHTIASHSDTTASGSELNELTGGGDTTLHDHDGISENTSSRHTRSHTMTSTSDHTAGNWKLFASNGSGEITEITHGADTYVLTSSGTTSAPTWQEPSGGMQMKTGSYTSSGGDNVNIDIGIDLAGATYKYIVIKRDGADAAVHKFGHVTSDYTDWYTSQGPSINRIQAWTSTGFQVGTASQVNLNGETYNYMVVYQE